MLAALSQDRFIRMLKTSYKLSGLAVMSWGFRGLCSLVYHLTLGMTMAKSSPNFLFGFILDSAS